MGIKSPEIAWIILARYWNTKKSLNKIYFGLQEQFFGEYNSSQNKRKRFTIAYIIRSAGDYKSPASESNLLTPKIIDSAEALPVNKNDLKKIPESSYPELLQEVKSRIQFARNRAITSVNQELMLLYYDVGKIIVERQEKEGWGRNVVERLALDLRSDLQNLKGFSPSNMWRMRAFFLAWREKGKKLAQPVREIPWGHNIILIETMNYAYGTRRKQLKTVGAEQF